MMLRYALVGLSAAVIVGVTFIPDDALAYRGGGVRAGGVRAAGVRGGAVAGRGVAYRGAAVGVAGRGVAYRGAAYRGPLIVAMAIVGPMERRSGPRQ